MPRAMILRIKNKSGRFSLSSLYPESTLSDLQRALKEKTQLAPAYQKILIGYPPREVKPCVPSPTLVSLRIRSGDTLILEEVPHSLPSEKGTGLKTSGEPSTSDGFVDLTGGRGFSLSKGFCVGPQDSMGGLLSSQLSSTRGTLIRRVVPADNSCLFTSVSILLCDGRESSSDLRELAAGLLLSDPEKYSSAVLGQSPQEYVKWLRKTESWGGAIELRVFSEHFKVELDVVDIQTQRVDRFGEDKGYQMCAFLLYDGVHYDPLVAEGGVASQQGVFPINDDTTLIEAMEIAREAHQARQFTDLSQFSLRCMVCNKGLKGQADAIMHAKQTGHGNFGEV